MQMKWLIGVDEAGRGPLAGPLAVGAVRVSRRFSWEKLPPVKDSKKMTEKARERVFDAAQKLQEKGSLSFHVALVSAADIDRLGLTRAVQHGIDECMAALASDPAITEVRLDGLLKAPEAYVCQSTIIGGDVSEPAISLASIVAKVTRDHYMHGIHAEHPNYNFVNHKGYATRAHYEALRAHGPSPVHRQTFLRKFFASQAE